MATLTIRNLPDDVRDQLRIAAAKNGRSMEAEARAVLTRRFAPHAQKPDLEAIRERLRRAQAAIVPYLPKDRSLTDEFLADRKKMWGEE
jgi:plasmid stability protein